MHKYELVITRDRAVCTWTGGFTLELAGRAEICLRSSRDKFLGLSRWSGNLGVAAELTILDRDLGVLVRVHYKITLDIVRSYRLGCRDLVLPKLADHVSGEGSWRLQDLQNESRRAIYLVNSHTEFSDMGSHRSAHNMQALTFWVSE